MDRNNYYGAESASLNLTQVRVSRVVPTFSFCLVVATAPSRLPALTGPVTSVRLAPRHSAVSTSDVSHCAFCAKHNAQLWDKFRPGEKPPADLGRSNDYNVDSCPKFIMANGKLVQMLLYADVVKYLEFKAVDGSFVVRSKQVHKVPSNDMEAIRSPLVGLFEKRRLRSFFIFVQDYVADDPRTWQGMDLRRTSMRAVYEYFGLDEGTTDFIGHSLALQRTDEYMEQPALESVLAIKLYAESMARFGGGSPYIYPLYGLGELPQAFARLSAVYGGTYMLNKPDCVPVFDDATGRVVGVRSGEETAHAPLVVGDPSYFPGRTRRTAQVARAMCLMSHPIPGTSDASSAQIIIPYKQVPGRRSDIYVFCCSSSHNVVSKGKYVAFVSCRLESGSKARAQEELGPGLALLGSVDHVFVDVCDIFEPLGTGAQDGCFISKGYDETSHFESVTEDVLDLYKRITGKDLDLENTDVRKAGEQQ